MLRYVDMRLLGCVRVHVFVIVVDSTILFILGFIP